MELSAALPLVSVLAVCPATCAHKCSARRTQTCRSCLHPEIGTAGVVVAAPGPCGTCLAGGCIPFPPISSQFTAVLSNVGMLTCVCCTTALGGCCFCFLELLSSLCIKQLSSSCFLLSFLLCLMLPPVPLHCQLPLCLSVLNSFFHLGFFFTKQTSSSSLCSLSTL